MLYEFTVYQMEAEKHIFWVAESRLLKGCVGQGETSDEAIAELEANETIWLETAKEYRIPIPSPTLRKERTCSGKFALRMSPYVHEKAAEAAKELEISLNQFINDAVVDYTARIEAAARINHPAKTAPIPACRKIPFPHNNNASKNAPEKDAND